MKRLRRYIIQIALAGLLTFAFMLVAFLSRGQVVADPPKIVEETIKSVIAIFVVYMNVYWAHSVAMREFEQRLAATRATGLVRVKPLRSAILLLLAHKQPELGVPSLETLQENDARRRAVEQIIREIGNESERLHQWLYSQDVRVTNTFSTLLGGLSALNVAHLEYRISPTNGTLSNVITTSQRLEFILDRFQSDEP